VPAPQRRSLTRSILPEIYLCHACYVLITKCAAAATISAVDAAARLEELIAAHAQLPSVALGALGTIVSARGVSGYTFSEILAAVLTAIYLCSVCSCQEILRRNGRKVSGYTFSEILFRNLMAVEVIESSGYGSSTMAAAQPTRGGSLVLPIAAVVSLLGGAAAVYLSLRSRRFRRWWGLRSLRLSKAELEAL
jgi:hypothetical protein